MDHMSKPKTFKAGLSGKHRKTAETLAFRYPDPWAPTLVDRWQQFKDWRYLAMQVLRKNKGPFGVMVVLEEFFDMTAGHCLATNEELAGETGRCAVKTIDREIQAMRRLGLILTEPYWIQRGGKKVKGRRIRLAIPADISDLHIR